MAGKDKKVVAMQAGGLLLARRSQRLRRAGGYADNLEKQYYYRKDHLGNNREVWRADNNTTVQCTQYYPSGLPWYDGTGANIQPYKYNGKEFIEMHGYDSYDYGARGYYPAAVRFMTPDPLAEVRPWESPYLYCGGNPIRRIDPTGMIWDEASLDEVNRLKATLNNRINELNSKVENYQAAIESGTLSDAEVEAYTNEISAFGEMASNLGTSVTDIDRLGNDQRRTYVLNSNESTTNGYVERSTNGKVNIVGDGGSLTVHEITHVRQSLDAGRLNFSNTNNRLQYTGPGAVTQANAEVEAYQMQFSVRRTDLGSGLNLRSPSQITPQIVGNMRHSNGTLVYPAVYNRYVRGR